MYALQLSYISHFGEGVFRHIPAFKTFADCMWWSDWFGDMLTSDHATSIVTACVAVAT